MMHAMKETLLAHMDGELSRAEAQEVTEHLGRCSECVARAARLREAAGIFGAALRTIDAAEPASWNTGSTRADGAQGHVIPLRPRNAYRPGSAPLSARSRVDLSQLRRAAAILLVTAAAASAAVLGGRALLDVADPAGTLTVTPAPHPPAIATVAVPPEDGRVHIALENAGTGTRVTAVLTSAAEATVTIEGAASHVTAAGSRISVNLNGAAATVRLALPTTLREAELVAGGTRVIHMRNGVVTPAAALDEGVVIGSRLPTDP